MRRLLHVDVVRIFRSKWFWISTAGMLALSGVFMVMQYTSMARAVPLSRVIFLPMSFYGMAAAALISLFAGEDFSDGFIRNKVITGYSKKHIFASNFMVCSFACVLVYLLVSLFTASIGCFFFENDVPLLQFIKSLMLGIGMCLSYSGIFCTITMLSGNKTNAVLICMVLAFSFLCICLHTNQVMVQPEYKNGMPNPDYRYGFAKAVYAFLHDPNPTGQAAQLSAMKVFSPLRWIACDVLWIIFAGMGCKLFNRKDLK